MQNIYSQSIHQKKQMVLYRRAFSKNLGPTWNIWGNSPDQKRFQEESVSRINIENISNLERNGYLEFQKQEGLDPNLHLAGGLLFFGSQSGLVMQLMLRVDVYGGHKKAKAEVRNAIAIDLDESNPFP
ncbi:MAG: hypothetical protein Ct9H90mP13_07000 [Pseudomonadota bacterium]|nr:MAG: hypothetical protein Ct9H90mP13_07000 [Pseudomonadota bacterium]